MRTSNFDYHLPADRIAQTPVEPRHDSRLLDARTMTEHRFHQLPTLLTPGDLVVVNRTRVRHGRLAGHKLDTGGEVEVLVLAALTDGTWEALIRPARRIRPGTALMLAGMETEVVSGPVDGVVRLRFPEGVDVEARFQEEGEVPLPPYITVGLSDPGRYQTIYAERVGSAAAPTAGLHITRQVLEELAARQIEVAGVDLQVGIATFRPISTESIEDHRIHSERFEVPEGTAEAVARCRERGGRVVAVGTTTVRALESAANLDGTIKPGAADTDLYLVPGSPIRCVDLLVTNFHLPASTLLVLLEAFMGPGWREVYAAALDRGFRFLSFGDAMICRRRP